MDGGKILVHDPELLNKEVVVWRPLIKNDLFPLLNLAMPLVLTGIVQTSLNFFETIFLELR